MERDLQFRFTAMKGNVEVEDLMNEILGWNGLMFFGCTKNAL